MATDKSGVQKDTEQCDVTIFRAATGAVQTFTLRAGGLLRIGRGVANDIVMDFNGVSVYHAELYLRQDLDESGVAGVPMLCIRDDSKNGTGVRPGPHTPGNDKKQPPAWELLSKGSLRVLDHGWQLIVPSRSRKDNSQLPEANRVLTIYLGTKVGPILPDEELDGEVWEPAASKAKRIGRGVPPPPRDLGGGAFEEAPPPPEERRRAEKEARKLEKKERKEREKREREEQEREARAREERKREKKAKKLAKKGREASALPEDDEEAAKLARKERRREKKQQKNKRTEEEEDNTCTGTDEGDEEAVDNMKDSKEAEAKAAQARDREARERVAYLAGLDKARREREEKEKERQRLERELEDELNEELVHKGRPAALTPGIGTPAAGAVTPKLPVPQGTEEEAGSGSASAAVSPAPVSAPGVSADPATPLLQTTAEPASPAPPVALAFDQLQEAFAAAASTPGINQPPTPMEDVQPTVVEKPPAADTVDIAEAKAVEADSTQQPGAVASAAAAEALGGVVTAVTAIAEEPAGDARSSSAQSPTPDRTGAVSRTEIAGRSEGGGVTDAGISDAEVPPTSIAGDVPAGGLTAAALAEHSRVLPPIGGEARALTDGRSVAGRSVGAGSAIAPSAVAPSVAPTVHTFRTHATKGDNIVQGQAAGGLTAAALAAHSAALPPIGGTTREAAMATMGKSDMKSLAGKSLAQTEKTFHTHMTTRSLLVGASVMRELMRSVSPISEPGVNIKRRRPLPSESMSPTALKKKKKKKEKKEKDTKVDDDGKKKARPGVPRMTTSASHWRMASPSGGSHLVDTSAAPSHWKNVSESAEPALPKKKASLRKARDASPCSAGSGDHSKKRKAKLKRNRDGYETIELEAEAALSKKKPRGEGKEKKRKRSPSRGGKTRRRSP